MWMALPCNSRKIGARDELKPFWLNIGFCNGLPNFAGADEAFARRPTVMPMFKAFKAKEDFDPSNSSHMIADNTMKTRAGEFGPELLYWIRCLVEGLSARKDTTVIRPRSKVVEAATAEELEIICAKPLAREHTKEKIKDFVDKLIPCSRGMVPSNAKDVAKALADATGMKKQLAAQTLVDAGLKTKRSPQIIKQFGHTQRLQAEA